MRTLSLLLLDGWDVERIDGIASLVAADASGQFGIQPGHAALVTVLEPGLFRFRDGTGAWTCAACVGGMLGCASSGNGTEVRIVSRRFLRDVEPEALQSRLDELLRCESRLRLSVLESQARIEQTLHRRLQQLTQASA